MSKKIIALASATAMLLGSCLNYTSLYNPVFTGRLADTQKQLSLETDNERVEKIIKLVDESKRQEEEHLRIQEEQRIQREKELAEQKARDEEHQRKNTRLDRGGNNTYNKVEVRVHRTFYTNLNNRMQGGQYDKLGKKRLASYQEPICAAPSNIPYGSYVKFNGTMYKVVDTGGAITWLPDGRMCVDVFIPNVSYEWIIKNRKIEDFDATLYIKNN